MIKESVRQAHLRSMSSPFRSAASQARLSILRICRESFRSLLAGTCFCRSAQTRTDGSPLLLSIPRMRVVRVRFPRETRELRSVLRGIGQPLSEIRSGSSRQMLLRRELIGRGHPSVKVCVPDSRMRCRPSICAQSGTALPTHRHLEKDGGKCGLVSVVVLRSESTYC